MGLAKVIQQALAESERGTGNTRTLPWRRLPRDLLRASGRKESSGLADGRPAQNAKLGNSGWP